MQYHIVKINLPNPSLWEVGTYSFTLKIYKDVTQATHTSYTISYSVNLTDTLTTILNGLKQITDDSQTEPDNIVFVDVESVLSVPSTQTLKLFPCLVIATWCHALSATLVVDFNTT